MDYVDVHDFCSVSALVIGAPGMRVDTAPKASGCFFGGTQEIFGAVSEDLLGGTAKAEDAEVQGAGIIPKLCPMEREEMEAMHGNLPGQSNEYRSHSWRKKEDRNRGVYLGFLRG